MNPSDISIFSLLISGVYDPCCELAADGVCNLSDIGVLSIHRGHTHMAGFATDVVD